MYLLILDILIYNLTPYNSFFFLLSLFFLRKNDYLRVIILGLILDFIILDKFLINTVILLIIFTINKKIIPLKNRDLKTYLIFNIISYLFFVLCLAVINQKFNFSSFIESLIIQIIFILTSYKMLKKHIKLVR